jgi:hypothetical protein
VLRRRPIEDVVLPAQPAKAPVEEVGV